MKEKRSSQLSFTNEKNRRITKKRRPNGFHKGTINRINKQTFKQRKRITRCFGIDVRKPGGGKTHLANAIGLEAIKQSYKVVFIHVNELIERLSASRADGTYNLTLNHFLNSNLLILDEIGFKKLPDNGLDDFFEIIRKRYEKAL